MRRLRELLDRPLREQPRAAFAIGACIVVALLLVSTLPSGHHADSGTTAAKQQPPPPVVNADGQRAPATATSAAPSERDLALARHSAQAFLASYLPALYGKRPMSAVVNATPHVRRALAKGPTVPRAIRRRTPRLIGLDAQPQAARSVLMTATVDDGAVAPFHLIFTVERQPDGRWLVTDLAND